MKPYLVDVPVRVNIWIRPECQQRQFEVLKKARPSIIFLQSDGGRNEKEWEAIYQNRKLIDEGIDWECTVYRLYETKNNGLYAMGKKVVNSIWSKVDRCIFLEDDQVPSVSYFRYCAELLEKYKDDERIQAICGMNHCGTWDRASSDYFFATEGSIWGMATWKRIYDQRDLEFKYGEDAYTLELLKEQTKKEKVFWKAVEGYTKNECYGNHVAGAEFYNRFEIYAQHRLYIIPTKNMINNIGCTADGAHATEYKLLPRGIRRIFNMNTYELENEIRHPNYIIPDEEYVRSRNRIMAVGHPFIYFLRRIESFFLRIYHTGLNGLIKRIKTRTTQKGTLEK